MNPSVKQSLFFIISRQNVLQQANVDPVILFDWLNSFKMNKKMI